MLMESRHAERQFAMFENEVFVGGALRRVVFHGGSTELAYDDARDNVPGCGLSISHQSNGTRSKW